MSDGARSTTDIFRLRSFSFVSSWLLMNFVLLRILKRWMTLNSPSLTFLVVDVEENWSNILHRRSFRLVSSWLLLNFVLLIWKRRHYNSYFMILLVMSVGKNWLSFRHLFLLILYLVFVVVADEFLVSEKRVNCAETLLVWYLQPWALEGVCSSFDILTLSCW